MESFFLVVLILDAWENFIKTLHRVSQKHTRLHKALFILRNYQRKLCMFISEALARSFLKSFLSFSARIFVFEFLTRFLFCLEAAFSTPFPLSMISGLNGLTFHQQLLQRHLLAQQHQHYQQTQQHPQPIEKTNSDIPAMVQLVRAIFNIIFNRWMQNLLLYLREICYIPKSSPTNFSKKYLDNLESFFLLADV